ncbi:glutamine--fructose-6-phosphate transaminase (isomerizing) [Chloroflexota bacterium]
MCGIVGYTGKRQAQSVIMDILSKLEYRGYDSCSIALTGSGLKVIKDAVRVGELARTMPSLKGVTGIGHTRWATHGEPNQVNAHPHTDCSGQIAVVHNGIITNFDSLRRQLTSEGHKFLSDTDTEVIAHLIEKYFTDNLQEAVKRALQDVEGSYAVAVVVADSPDIVVARKESPLILGVGDRENFIASDVPAVLDYTNRVLYLEDGDIGLVSPNEIRLSNGGVRVNREEHKILWSAEQARKGGYEHFMLKEIHEQPRVIRDTLMGGLTDSPDVGFDCVLISDSIDTLLMMACGTSYHAALVGKTIFEELLGIPAKVEIASEFNYYKRTLVGKRAIVITQSGETADTLRAIKRLKQAGCKVTAITNVMGSTASRIADAVFFTKAGPEMSVAATKTFVGQLLVLCQMAMSCSGIDIRRRDELIAELRQLPQKVQQVLDDESRVADIARYLADYENVFFIGRGINYPVALEGALKLKEISYIHAEGYAAGELKHGPFALLSAQTPVVAIVSRDDSYDAIISNVREVKARKSPVIMLAGQSDEQAGKFADFVITLPEVDIIFSPLVNVVVLQLLAYYTAKYRGCSIDFPRNLAKSVTVE